MKRQLDIAIISDVHLGTWKMYECEEAEFAIVNPRLRVKVLETEYAETLVNAETVLKYILKPEC